MKHTTKSVLCLMLILAMLTGLACGCGNSAESVASAESESVAESVAAGESAAASETQSTTEASTAETPAPSEPVSSEEIQADDALLNKSSGIKTREGGTDIYPIDTDAELTMIMPYAGMAPDILPCNQENIVLIEAEKRTGIHINVQDISMTAYEEQLALVIASGDLPDMVANLTANYTSGVDAAIEDEVIIDLSQYRDYAPNYFYIIDNNPIVKKDTATDAGAVGGFYKLQAAMAAPKSGVHIRGDWLDELGLETPHTIDEFTEVFSAFHEAHEGTTLWIENTTASLFAYAYGIVGGDGSGNGSGNDLFIQVDGKVKYSPVEEGYRQYLTQLHDWYEAGYLNKDFMSLDSSTMGTSDLTKALGVGEVGVWGGFADTPAQITSTIDGFVVAEHYRAIPNPVLNEGDVLHLGTVMDTVDGASSSITPNCSDIETAMRWFDYWYSEEGSILYTYGIEDTTFYWNEDHQAMFTDLIVNNPDYPAFFMQMTYMLDQGFGLLYAYREGCIYGYDSDIVKTPQIWLGDNYDGAYIISSKLSPTLEEAEEYASKYVDIETYVSEHVAAFVTGAQPLDDFDKFVDTIYDMGIEDVLAVKQAAFDRYAKR